MVLSWNACGVWLWALEKRQVRRISRVVGAGILAIEDQMAKLDAEVLATPMGCPWLGLGWVCRWRKEQGRELGQQRKEGRDKTK